MASNSAMRWPWIVSLAAFLWSAQALAEPPATPTAATPRPVVHEGFFDKPVFLSLGAVATLGNPEARGTFGGELSFVRWLDDRPGHFTLGSYAQGEYVAGNTGRVSGGLQASYALFGIETGYAYQRLLEDKLNQHSLQITPFISTGTWYIGFRMLVPVTPTGAPIGMLVLGLKIPINVGKDMDIDVRLFHWD